MTGIDPDRAFELRQRREDTCQIMIGISACAALSLWFARRYPLANIGIALMIVSLVLEMDCWRTLRLHLRSICAEASLRDSVAATRKRVAEAIETARLAVIPPAVPLGIGVLLHETALREPLPVLAVWLAALTVLFALAHLAMEREIRRNLVPFLAGIDREPDEPDSNQAAEVTAGAPND